MGRGRRDSYIRKKKSEGSQSVSLESVLSLVPMVDAHTSNISDASLDF